MGIEARSRGRLGTSGKEHRAITGRGELIFVRVLRLQSDRSATSCLLLFVPCTISFEAFLPSSPQFFHDLRSMYFLSSPF